ncbi:GNAT family N-acetyltransferase [Pacificimonas sp. WHA3]|uniref:GNAT family N-acetyltransferase n=1 Tax=Pacificimonas pallii TaxID=2827236 RepID=A0ABS6SC52_9SPHN|nr:GNAT family N-acetyltransferase [Pacificimonas pallii]MBV7255906.1 GNAT family N-acetyltransferase [Pacificimonas pallii]
MKIRPATPIDAPRMSEILQTILDSWSSARPGSVQHITSFYINHPDQVSCLVALSGTGQVIGFQSLKKVGVGNEYDVTPGWGVIGTYVDLTLPRKGVGRLLFKQTIKNAQESGIEFIDATMSKTNARAVSFYEAIGFRTYRTEGDTVYKFCSVASS